MVFGGLQKNSLIDYPGKLSCVLFLSGCNFNCPYCHNPDLAKGRLADGYDLDETRIYEFLKKRRHFLDAVVVSGGEPTLHKDLFFICEKIKQLGYPVKLDTNGSRPEALKALIEQGLVDYIAMDIKTDPLEYSPFIAENLDPDHIISCIHTIMQSSIPHEFRTTCIKPFVSDRIVERIARYIEGCDLYALQRFNQTEVLHPDFFQNNECLFDEDELSNLKSIAEQWVHNCIIR
jgi:pyruvate formate lyase activating enzyme